LSEKKKKTNSAQKTKVIDQAEEDYEKGVRFVVDDLFFKSFETLFDTFLIPSKLASLPLGMISYGFLRFREKTWKRLLLETTFDKAVSEIKTANLDRFNAMTWSASYVAKFILTLINDSSELLSFISNLFKILKCY